MTMRKLIVTVSMASLAVALAGCGGEGSGSIAPIPIASAPPPPPSASPPPPPPPPVAGPAIAQVRPGGTLIGDFVCAAGDFVYENTADGGRRLANVTRVGAPVYPISAPAIRIEYRATNSFVFDLNGFGGSTFLPADLKNEPAGATYAAAYFRKLPVQQYVEELEIDIGNGPFGGLVNASLGRLSDGGSLCFFAVGSDRGPIATQGTRDFFVVADGLALIGGASRRIGVSTASARTDWVARTVDISFDITTTGPPFGASTNGASLGRATARLTFSQGGFIGGPLAGPDGSTGGIGGQFFEFGNGAGLVFDLAYPNGDRIFGSLALDGA